MKNQKEKKKADSFIFSANHLRPLETKPNEQTGGKKRLGNPGGCVALPKQTTKQTNN